MILLIDNYDSFVYNLARYIERLGQSVRVLRNDQVDVSEIRCIAPDAIIISPGPCTPDQAGCSLDVVRQLYDSIPILGVCLGHQTIAQAFGAKIVRAAEPVHGRTAEITHSQSGLFANVASPTTVCRYHSLVIDPVTLPAELEITAQSEDGIIMAVEHRRYPVVGTQFHPESVLTATGYQLLANFLKLAGLKIPIKLPTLEDELVHSRSKDTDSNSGNSPITF